MVSGVTLEGQQWAEMPYRFEAGTPNIGGVIALGAAVDFLRDHVHLADRQKEEASLARRMRHYVSEVDGARVFGDAGDNSPICSFSLAGIHPHDVAQYCDEFNVAIRAGHLCAQPLVNALGVPALCRASLAVYNEENDLKVLADALRACARFFHVS